MRKVWMGLALLIAALTAYLLLWPVDIDPVSWTPPPERPLTTNSALAAVERVGKDLGGPEGLAIDAQGRIHAGLKDGRVVRIARDGGIETIASTGGRPLGMQFDPSGRLIVGDAVKGLLAISPQGAITVLATEHGGVRFGFTDDLDIAKDGTVYFSDASHRFGPHDYKKDVLEHRPNGRLLAWRPDGRVELLKGDLYFANGVALAADESHVIVSETAAYRLTRVWLSPEKKGSSDVLIDGLPGFPDNVTRSPSKDLFWVALFAPRNRTLDSVAQKPFWRKVMQRLPAFLQPRPARHAFVLGVDSKGAIVHDLQDASPDAYAPITSALEHDGKLYLGSLTHDQIGIVRAP